MQLTPELIKAAAQGGTGYNRKQLAALGVSWPPTRGWLKAQIGREVTEEQYAAFVGLGRKARLIEQTRKQNSPEIENYLGFS